MTTTPPNPHIPGGYAPPPVVKSGPPPMPPPSTRRGRAEVEVKLSLQNGVVVQPGDTLVLVTSGHLSDAEIADLEQELTTRLPGVAVTVAEGFDQALVYRPDEFAEDDDVERPDPTRVTTGGA